MPLFKELFPSSQDWGKERFSAKESDIQAKMMRFLSSKYMRFSPRISENWTTAANGALTSRDQRRSGELQEILRFVPSLIPILHFRRRLCSISAFGSRAEFSAKWMSNCKRKSDIYVIMDLRQELPLRSIWASRIPMLLDYATGAAQRKFGSGNRTWLGV